MNRHQKSRRCREPKRHGAVVVELALTFPILFLFLVAQIEFSRANMVRHALVTASFQGCRAGIVLGTTAMDVEEATRETLESVGLTDYSVTIVPQVITPATAEVSVEVSAPIDGNSWIAPLFLGGTVLKHKMTMEREQHDQLIF